MISGKRRRKGSLLKTVPFAVALLFIAVPLAEVFASASPPTIDNPTVFTYQTSAPKVDGTTGALTEQIKLDIPPGRNGLQPDLSLNYNSQDSGNGIVGSG